MTKIKYLLANGAKFHHFKIAKALYEKNQLSKIVCGYPWFKLKYEKIPKRYVRSKSLFQILGYPFSRINIFRDFEKIYSLLDTLNSKYIDNQICREIKTDDSPDVLLTLSPIGLKAGRKMIKENKTYICERSSSHILFQEKLLAEEYETFMNKKFKINSYFV